MKTIEVLLVGSLALNVGLALVTMRHGSAVRSVSAVQKDVTARADAVRTNAQLSPEQRAAQLGALADEAKARITESFGSRGFGPYQRYSGGWLEMLRAPTNAGQR